MSDSEINAHRNPLRLWKSFAARPGACIDIVSVGVTSKTAESVLLGHGQVRLLTRLRTLDFVSGESDLRCLRRLVSEGVPVFHHPEVKVNVVVSRGQAVSLGSRGLQAARSSSRHLTWSTEAEATIKETQDLVDSWFADAEPVTLELIEEIDKTLRLQESVIREMRKAAEKIDAGIEAGKPEREARRKRQDLDRRRREASVARLISAAERAAAPSESKICEQQYRPHYDAYGFETGGGNQTLLGLDHDLLSWWYDGSHTSLKKTSRYLFVLPELGRVGWARVMKTRITKIGLGIDWSEAVEVAGRSYKVGFESDWSDAPANVLCKLSRGRRGIESQVEITGFFSVDGFDILSIGGNDESEIAHLRSHRAELSTDIARRLLQSFKYEYNLLGYEMFDFLGRHRWWRLRLGMLEGQRFIVGTMA